LIWRRKGGKEVSETYKIVKLEDFAKIPSAKLGQCLKEFKEALELYYKINETFPAKIDYFTWVDDGKHGLVVKLNDVEMERK
jgi:hypothetical protein